MSDEAKGKSMYASVDGLDTIFALVEHLRQNVLLANNEGNTSLLSSIGVL